MNEIYLFPETPDFNPSSFLSQATLISPKEVKVKCFKICLFMNRLDQLGYPFIVAPIPSGKHSAYFYQYQFLGPKPSFVLLGFEEKPTNSGIVISLKQSTFLQMSTNCEVFSIPKGRWSSYFEIYHQLAALYHLDIIPSFSSSFLELNILPQNYEILL